ncbi:MAG: hypothetical protein FWC91_14695, partial [Defluviitaleaceae bacterium]|nr:hypothetical protein [Defluviitaleaceae bacterium]
MWGHVASSRGGSVDVDAAIALFVLAAILSVLYIILSTTIRNTTRKDIRENISKLPYEIKIYLMNTLYANADTAIKCTKCNSPSLYFRDKSGYLFSNTQEYQSEMFYESNIFCIKCIGIGDPQDTICQTDTNDLVNKLSKEKKQEKKRVSKEASKLFSHEEKTELILSLHENAENALKCPHCDLPSFYCDSNTLWQPFSPQNHEMMLLLEQHIYCIKCDLGWESISPKHTIFYLP